MRSLGLLIVLWTSSLSGCVIGYGRCLFLAPIKAELGGKVHFREFPRGDRIDHVPILSLDRTVYIYAPAASKQCQSADEVQLVPLADLPDDIAENAQVVVEGKLVEATQDHQHTRFAFNVDTIRLVKLAPPK